MIPRTATEEDLRLLFSGYGDVEDIVLFHEKDGTNKGCDNFFFSKRDSLILFFYFKIKRLLFFEI